MPRFYSPLRYPGGKRKLVGFMKLVYERNGLLDGEYAEPYCGGAAIGLALLLEHYCSRIHINDLDPSIHAFWASVLDETEELSRLIRDTPVTMEEWHRQKAIQGRAAEVPTLELGFSTFFLNRTNRSGVIRGGVIGGKNQEGPWGIAARFTKDNLIQRIQHIARYRSRIDLTCLDAEEFLRRVADEAGDVPILTYIDPPYYTKGRQLYRDRYTKEGHAQVAQVVRGFARPWIVTYDQCEAVDELYSDAQRVPFGIRYSAADRYEGKEVMFASRDLRLPPVEDPTKISKKEWDALSQVA